MSIRSAKKRKEMIIEDSWSIDYAFAKWIIPRLDLLIKRDFGHPLGVTGDEWMSILQEMRNGFFNYYRHDECPDEALELFKKYFYNLWD